MVNMRAVAISVIALVLLFSVAGIFGLFATSGYGGIASRVNGIDHDYYPAYVNVEIGTTIASIHPNTIGALGASGLRLEIGQPQYTGDDLRYEHQVVQKTDRGDLIREWEVRIAYFDMSWTITTDAGGALPICDVDFWIELKENEFDVFTAADAVEAYILEVVTIEPVSINDAVNVKVSPAASGFNFDLEALNTEPVPDWMQDAGYQGVLSEFKHVRFKVTAESMQPTQIGLLRWENGATWKAQVRALVFGFWETLSPYDRWDFVFYGWLDWLDDLFQGLEIIIGLAVGILLSVVILKFVPDKRLAAAILIVTWVIVFIGFGFLEMFA